MSVESSSQRKTQLFARVLGPFLVVVPLTAALRAPQMQALLSDFEGNPLWPWVVGSFVLLIGLVVVALHTSWQGPAAVMISVLGWLLVLRGILLMAFPAAFMAAANAVIGAGLVWRIGYVGLALAGVYLTAVGWWPAGRRARD